MFARWEWIIMELLALGFLVWELVSVRRSIAKDRRDAAAASGAQERGAGSAEV